MVRLQIWELKVAIVLGPACGASPVRGCSGWALAPFWFVFGFCCLLCFSAGETQVWLGDLPLVVFCLWFLWLCVGLIDLPNPMDLCPCINFFVCSRSYKNRAFSATSAKLEEKNTEKHQGPGQTASGGGEPPPSTTKTAKTETQQHQRRHTEAAEKTTAKQQAETQTERNETKESKQERNQGTEPKKQTEGKESTA